MGMSSGDFTPALGEFFGDAGLSASVITRLTKSWQEERERFADRSVADVGYVYCWADGVHFNVCLAEERLCCLVIVGVRADGNQGARRHRRRPPGVDRQPGGPAQRRQKPGHASPKLSHCGYGQ